MSGSGWKGILKQLKSDITRMEQEAGKLADFSNDILNRLAYQEELLGTLETELQAEPKPTKPGAGK